MDPYQSGPPQGSFNPQQYDFITNPKKSSRKGLFSFGKGNKTGTLVIIAVGLIAFTLILLVGSLFFGGGSDKETLLNVAQKQSQILAIAKIGEEDAGTSQTQSLALAVSLSVTTEQQAIVAKMNEKGEVKPKEYAAGAGADVTEQLEIAQRNGRFDEVFTNIMKDQLTQYQQELRTANAAVSSESTKTLLAKDFDSAGLLLQIQSN